MTAGFSTSCRPQVEGWKGMWHIRVPFNRPKGVWAKCEPLRARPGRGSEYRRFGQRDSTRGGPGPAGQGCRLKDRGRSAPLSLNSGQAKPAAKLLFSVFGGVAVGVSDGTNFKKAGSVVLNLADLSAFGQVLNKWIKKTRENFPCGYTLKH